MWVDMAANLADPKKFSQLPLQLLQTIKYTVLILLIILKVILELIIIIILKIVAKVPYSQTKHKHLYLVYIHS